MHYEIILRNSLLLVCYDETMKTRAELYDYLNSQQLGVISTITSKGKPSAAVIGFGQTPELEIVFGTDNSSRKYQNIKNNPHVSFAIGGGTGETIQYEGTARELGEGELDLIANNYWNKNPHAKSHHQNPGQRYFIISPAWIRYTDVSKNPWDIVELEL